MELARGDPLFLVPVPALALRAIFGEAAVVLTSGVTSATSSRGEGEPSRIIVPLRGKDRALGVLLLERTGAADNWRG